MMVTVITFLQVFVHYLERILSFLVLVRVILSWFPAARGNFFGRIVVDTTQPFFNIVYRFLPQMRMSMMDFSPIIVFLGISWVSELIIRALGAVVG